MATANDAQTSIKTGRLTRLKADILDKPEHAEETAVSEELATTKKAEQELFALLAELGGGITSDSDVVHQGTRLILPTSMTTKQAIKLLERHRDQEQEVTEFNRVFKYRPWDGAAALQVTLKRLFGTAGLPTSVETFFGTQRPELRTINTGPHTTAEVPWGRIDFPVFGPNASLHSGSSRSSELGLLYQLTVCAPQKYGPQIQGLFVALQEELERNSIYRGQAFDGKPEPGFIDLNVIDPRQAIYAPEVEAALVGNVWSLIEHTQTMRDLGVPLKRAVLLEGPYGSGKTLTAFVTAIKAAKAKEKWTFIYCRPGRDDLTQVMATARLYQPSIVFYEDVDTIASTGEDDPLTKLMDLFDGIQAKGTEILVLLTTNHIERIHKAMARPGRLDAVVRIGALDSGGVQRMIEVTVKPTLIPDLDYTTIATAMDGFMPAFVKEAIDRTTRYAVARTGGQPDRLTTEDFVNAAEGLRPQHILMEKATEGELPPPLTTAMSNIIRESIEGIRGVESNSGMFELAQPNGSA